MEISAKRLQPTTNLDEDGFGIDEPPENNDEAKIFPR